MSEQPPPDASHLEGFDPYDALDTEAARLESHLSSLDDDGWAAQSRCSGWTVRDMVGHLAGVEQYHEACFDGRVAAVIEAGIASGMTSLDEFNQAGVDERADSPAADVVAEFVAADAETRRRFRARDGGNMDSTVGAYPVRWQAFHVATELATHADDIGAPVADDEAADRLAWRVAFSRFALTERRPGGVIEPTPEGTRVAIDDIDVVVDDETLVDALADRLADDAEPDVRAALTAPD
jgi:uncharacterized protein (TIGR03083 family)